MNAVRSALGAISLLAMTAIPAMAQDDVIKMGTLSWEDLTPITGITKKVLEDKGFTVEVTEFSEWGIAYAALAKGDIEILASQVDYVAQDYWDRNKRRLEKISPVSHGLANAVAVPSYVDINSIEEMNANADKFGGKIIGIEPGAGLMRDTAAVIDQYDLDLQLVEGSTAAMAAALKSAVDRKEWIAVTMWEPSWMVASFDVKFLVDPKGVFPPPQSYYWIGQDGFSAENPEARETLASIFIPLEDINAMNGEIGAGKTVDEAVAGWLESHQDLIARWENNKDY